MDATISSILGDLESHHTLNPLSHSTLSHLHSLFINLSHALSSDYDNPFWTEFSSRGLPLSSLVTPLAAAMDSAPSPLSILATNVYLLLFISSKAPVFSLFTPMSFMSFIHCIRRNLKNLKGGSSPNSSKNPRKKGLAGGAKGKRARVSNLDDVSEDVEFDAQMLFTVLERLKLVLGLVHLGRFPDSFKSLVQTMVEIVPLGVDLCGTNVGFCKKLFDICGEILSLVLSPEHGDQEMSAAEVLKSLSPLILSTKSQPRTFGLLFVKNRMMGLVQYSDFVKTAMVNLPRYLVQKAPEKSEARVLAVESIMEIVKVMEFHEQLGFVNYVLKMAQGKPHLRHLAVDFIPKLMISLGEDGSNSEIDSGGGDSWKARCLEALVNRCSDSIAGIRARALSSLVQLVANVPPDSRDCIVLKKALGFEKGREGEANELLRKRCTDEKAAVRKAALLLATKLMNLVGTSLDPAILKMMGLACSDPLVSIRKAAISALSEALRIFADKSVVTAWLHSVPRLITDSETSIQEECENLFMELVLDRISRIGCAVINNVAINEMSKSTAMNFETQLATIYGEGVLDTLAELCSGEVEPLVRKICTSLGKKKRLKPKIATSLQNIIKTSEYLWSSHSMPIENWIAPAGAWLLLSQVSSFLPKAVDWEFLHHHWKLLDKDGSNSNELKSSTLDSIMSEAVEGIESNSVAWAGDRVLLLETISNVSVELSPEPAAELAHDLLKRVEGFSMHSTEVNAHVKALKTLCRRKAMNPQEADVLVTTVAIQLLRKASLVIEGYLSAEQEIDKENTFLTPATTNRKMSKSEVNSTKLLCQATSAVYTIGSLFIICPAMEVKGVVPVLHSMITSGADEPRSNKLPGTHIFLKQNAPSLYIQAWLTMGKICLTDEKLAKRYIPLFVQELEKSNCAALRNNIVVMMADFCVRYTALVDCYMGKITLCLRDSCELIRRQTFILLSRLLQTDYVKWRGVLFLRFLLSLVDESEKIQQLADFLFGNILKAKAPLLAYNSFVEAIFVLNDCHAHMANNKTQTSRVESRLFSIRGNDDKSRSRRMHIYVSLLKQMAPEHLLAIFAKICAEVLAAVSDGILNIDDSTGRSVLQDAFQILTCKEIRLPSNRAPTTDSSVCDEEGGDSSSAVTRGRATQAVKKGLIQNTIPIFIELKRLLENKNSPLIGSLMDCLRVLLKDYKNEIDDILVADKQLQKEIIYDIQKYETGKAKSTALEAMGNSKRPENYRTPGGPKRVHGDSKVASAMGDMAAKSVARSVLKEVNQGVVTPPLSALNMPKLRPSEMGGLSKGHKSAHVIESLRKRQTFDLNEDI